MEQLQAKASIQISRPRTEVFEAIIDPQHMSQYFISESSGRMEEGATLSWSFPEFEGSFPVEVVQVLQPEKVSFRWDSIEDRKLLVEINLLEMENGTTLVKITEGIMSSDATGLKWFGQNTEGWANFLACLKAYLEYGINLRKGAFDYMRKD